MSWLRDLISAVARRRQPGEEEGSEHYRFWHLNYGEAAYYDQTVFKRHRSAPEDSPTVAHRKQRMP